MSRSQIEMLETQLSETHAEGFHALAASKDKVAAAFHVLLEMDGMALATRPKRPPGKDDCVTRSAFPRLCNHHDSSAHLTLSHSIRFEM